MGETNMNIPTSFQFIPEDKDKRFGFTKDQIYDTKTGNIYDNDNIYNINLSCEYPDSPGEYTDYRKVPIRVIHDRLFNHKISNLASIVCIGNIFLYDNIENTPKEDLDRFRYWLNCRSAAYDQPWTSTEQKRNMVVFKTTFIHPDIAKEINRTTGIDLSTYKCVYITDKLIPQKQRYWSGVINNYPWGVKHAFVCGKAYNLDTLEEVSLETAMNEAFKYEEMYGDDADPVLITKLQLGISLHLTSREIKKLIGDLPEDSIVYLTSGYFGLPKIIRLRYGKYQYGVPVKYLHLFLRNLKAGLLCCEEKDKLNDTRSFFTGIYKDPIYTEELVNRVVKRLHPQIPDILDRDVYIRHSKYWFKYELTDEDRTGILNCVTEQIAEHVFENLDSYWAPNYDLELDDSEDEENQSLTVDVDPASPDGDYTSTVVLNTKMDHSISAENN